MRRICHLVLAGLLALLPVQGAAESAAAKAKKAKQAAKVSEDEVKEAERAQSEEAPRRRRRHKAEPKVIELAPDGAAEAAKSDAPTGDAPAKVESPAPAAAKAADEDEGDLEDNPSKWLAVLSQKLPPRRYPYVLGVVLGGVGLVFAYLGQGEAKRAQTVPSAAEAQSAVSSAQASASLANVMYVMAAFSVLTAVVLEFLPEPAAEKASLTFHF